MVHYDIASWVAHYSIKSFWRRFLKSEYCESNPRINVAGCVRQARSAADVEIKYCDVEIEYWCRAFYWRCWDRVLPSLLLTMIFQFQPPLPVACQPNVFQLFVLFCNSGCYRFPDSLSLNCAPSRSNRPINGFINWAQLATFSQIMPHHIRLNTILSPMIGFLCKNKQILEIPRTCCIKNILTYFPTFQHVVLKIH